jgi:pimeloyl-ACP methyl ester carboxylesterase
MEELEEKGYNSLAPDLRGHGFSDMQKEKKFYDWPVFSSDICQIAKKENLKNFLLAGYCFGGSVALDFAAAYPDFAKGLVLISTNHLNPLKYKKIGFLTPLAVGILDILSILFLWQKRKKYLYYQHGQSTGYWHSVWIGLNTMPLSVNFWMLAMMGRLDLTRKISCIKIPTLIIHAKRDPFVSAAEARDMKSAIPGSKEIVLDHPSHFIGSKRQDDITKEILKFLEKFF